MDKSNEFRDKERLLNFIFIIHQSTMLDGSRVVNFEFVNEGINKAEVVMILDAWL